MRILARCDLGPEFTSRLNDWGQDGFDVVVLPERGEDDRFRDALAEAEILLHVLNPVTASMIGAAPNLRLIQKIGVGVNTIDIDAAGARGIAVCNMPGTNTVAVAEMTILLMLSVLRRLVPFAAEVCRPAGWVQPQGREAGLGEIAGRTIGFVGSGAVAIAAATICRAMGAETLYWSRTERAEMPARFVSFDELLGQVDILSLHVPLTDETAGILDAAAIERMKPGAILINTARGALVDEAALADALRHGHLLGAGLDVLAAEPPGHDNPLLDLPNVVATPHIAWLTAETWARSLDIARENALRLASGAALLHRVI